jgi:hypothetical protein
MANNVDEIRQHFDLLTDEELVAILQEHDEEQWRPEVFDIVASILRSRGVSAKPYAGPTENIQEDMDLLNLELVAAYVSDLDAETDRLTLERNGLKAWIFNDGDPGAWQLKVGRKDWAAALGMLEPEPPEIISSDLPEDIAEPPCPKCGSRKVTEQAELLDQWEPEHVWRYHCAACGHTWEPPADEGNR